MTLTRYKQNLKVHNDKVYSYNTHVATIEHERKIVVVHDYYSVTTSRHINYVAKELGYSTVKEDQL